MSLGSHITKQIDPDFFKDDKEKLETLGRIETILDDLFVAKDLDITTKDVLIFLEGHWDHFSLGRYAKVFLEFAKAEKALYGFELDEKGGRYRDHLIHLFNVFTTGLVAFSKMISQDKNATFELLKIRSEPEKLPFPNKYTKHRRLYYLWSLMATFHDIAIPVDHRDEMLRGLNRFLGYLRLETKELPINFPLMSESKIEQYFNLMSRFFSQGVKLNPKAEAPTYLLPEKSFCDPYLRSVLSDALENLNHGILGAYFLFSSIEEMFLLGREAYFKYDLDLAAVLQKKKQWKLPLNRKQWDNVVQKTGLTADQFDKLPRLYDLSKGETRIYNDYVFEQDASRAALAIALHSLDIKKYPKIFPIKFSKLPLTFLLTLFDEIQEFYRPEGISLVETVRFREFPRIKVNLHPDKKTKLKIEIDFSLKTPSSEDVKLMIKNYNHWAKTKGERQLRSYPELVRATWTTTFNRLKRKLSFGENEPVAVKIDLSIDKPKSKGILATFRT